MKVYVLREPYRLYTLENSKEQGRPETPIRPHGGAFSALVEIQSAFQCRSIKAIAYNDLIIMRQQITHKSYNVVGRQHALFDDIN